MKACRAFVWILAVAAMGLAVVELPAQEAGKGQQAKVEKSGQAATPDEVIEKYLESLKDKKKGTEILVYLETLGRFYSESLDEAEQIQLMLDRGQGKKSELKIMLRDGERLRAQLAAEVWKAFRFRTKSNDVNKGIWGKAIWVLGRMPEHGSKYLWKAFEDKRFRKDSKSQAECIRQIGETKDYTQYEELLDLLKHHDYQVIAASAQALGKFGEAPGKIRRECTKELVKKFEAFDNEARDGGSSGAGQRLGWTKRPMMKALEALTGETRDSSLGWTQFWNKNKKDKKLWKD